MRLCHRCGKENPDEESNCLRCGIKLDSIEAQTDYPPEVPEHFCYRHKNEPTNLACGRCGRYICTKCVVLGPAGSRCRECAKHDIAIRPTAIVHEAKVGIGGLFRTPYAFWILIVALGMIGGLIRSCASIFRPQPNSAYERYQGDDKAAPVEKQGE